MKKKLAITLILVLALGTCCACGGGAASSTAENTASAAESTAAPAESTSEEAEPENAEGSGDLTYETSEITDVGVSAADISIDVPSITYNAKPIENVEVHAVDNIEIPEMKYDVKEIEISEIKIPEMSLPEIKYEVKPIEAGNVVVNIPDIDAEISPYKVESIYSETYTMPDIKVDIPDYDAPELESVFVSMADGASEERQQALASLSPEGFAAVAAVQLDLAAELEKAFLDAGINVAIDPMSGSIPIDSTLLYDTDQYELTQEGKDSLKKIFSVYYSVLTQDKFRDAVEDVIIEGHTDTAGEYDYNKTLSEKRAGAVRDFLLSDECGLEDKAYLEGLLTTVGRSFEDPVFQEDGSVNMPASRRVEIRVEVKLG